MNPPDNRPRDDWGKPIGKAYIDKDWDELTPDEMQMDFEWKSDVLASYGEEVGGSTFYQDYLFRELYEGSLEGETYKVALIEYDAEDGAKYHKVDVDQIQDYLHLNDVALSPCLFHSNWRRKALLNYVSAFVLDIDRLRPMQLQRFFMLFEENRLLTPSFIANSGSGVHFYYLLDKMLPCDSQKNEANMLIADAIYRSLYDDVIKKEKWKDAQRHWLGQDYRVVNSKTKFQQTSQIFRTGETYTIEQLIEYYGIQIERQKRYATKKMVQYAKNIARNLEIDLPDFSNYQETYDFIHENQDADYLFRQEKKKERAEKEKKRAKKAKKKEKPGTWYENTLYYMRDHTAAGYRFSSMKALAVIAYKEREKVPREKFLQDLNELAEYWKTFDWKGDKFNARNVEAIERFYNNAQKYENTSSETLEEWLGYEFKRIGTKRRKKPLSQKEHVKMMNYMRDEIHQIEGWRNKDGAPTKREIVQEWQQQHQTGKKIECHRDTGLSRVTIDKWWNTAAVIEIEPEYYVLPDGQEVLQGQEKFK